MIVTEFKSVVSHEDTGEGPVRYIGPRSYVDYYITVEDGSNARKVLQQYTMRTKRNASAAELSARFRVLADLIDGFELRRTRDFMDSQQCLSDKCHDGYEVIVAEND